MGRTIAIGTREGKLYCVPSLPLSQISEDTLNSGAGAGGGELAKDLGILSVKITFRISGFLFCFCFHDNSPRNRARGFSPNKLLQNINLFSAIFKSRILSSLCIQSRALQRNSEFQVFKRVVNLLKVGGRDPSKFPELRSEGGKGWRENFLRRKRKCRSRDGNQA